MKKVIRLTESDLTRIVKRVINEQHHTKLTTEEKELIKNFLKKLNCGNSFAEWFLDPKKENIVGAVKVSISDIGDWARNSICWNYDKPLQWSFRTQENRNEEKVVDKYAFCYIVKLQKGLFFRYLDRYNKGGYIPFNVENALNKMNEISRQSGFSFYK